MLVSYFAENKDNIGISETLDITRLQLSMESLRVIKSGPADDEYAAYLTDRYTLIDPVQAIVR